MDSPKTMATNWDQHKKFFFRKILIGGFSTKVKVTPRGLGIEIWEGCNAPVKIVHHLFLGLLEYV